MYVAKSISVRPFARGCVEIGLRGAVSKPAIRIFSPSDEEEFK